MDPQAPTWSSLELRLLNTVDVFVHKPAIMKKAEAELQQLNGTLQNFLKNAPGLCPPETDTTKGQIARGENHKGFPFLSLDMPQLFSKETFFTFRTLFWWGHYLGFSLILQGEAMAPLAQALAARTDTSETDAILFSVSATPWEWATTEDCVLPLNRLTGPEILSQWKARGFIKLLKPFPMNQDGFDGLNWKETGLETFQEFLRLVGK